MHEDVKLKSKRGLSSTHKGRLGYIFNGHIKFKAKGWKCTNQVNFILMWMFINSGDIRENCICQGISL